MKQVRGEPAAFVHSALHVFTGEMISPYLLSTTTRDLALLQRDSHG